MRISRRTILLGSVCLATVGLGARLGISPGAIRDHAQDVIARIYGPEVSVHPAAVEFCEEYEAFLLSKGFLGHAANAVFNFRVQNLPVIRDESEDMERSIVVKFATSTNIVLASETGVELEYIGIFQPFEFTCANQLSYMGMV